MRGRERKHGITEKANKTEARGVHRTMFVILHRDFFSFVIFCNIKKKPPLPQDVLCFSGRVAVFPPPPPASGDSRSTDSGALSTGKAGGHLGLYRERRGGRGGVIYTWVRLHKTHTVFLQSSSLLGVFVFLFAKTIILNKCRLDFLRFCSVPAGGRGWRWVEWAAPHLPLRAAQTPAHILLLPPAD